MSKKKILFLLLTCVLCILAFCSCDIVDSTGEVVDSISFVSTDMNVEVGSFNPSNYSLLVSYNSGRTEKITLTQEMIPETEITKFYQFGERTITIEAFGQTCEAKFNITRKQIKDVYLDGFTYNQKSDMYMLSTFYTGSDFDIKVAGDIPAGSTYTYPQGSSFSKVGSYDFIVYISCENYETKKLYGNITINKAKYDMSSVKFDGVDDKNIYEVTYDGTRKEMKLTGTIPDGVKVSYKIQSSKTSEQFEDWPINAGNYYVYASFESDLVSYEPIPDMVAYLSIAKKQIKLDDVNFIDQEIVYDGKEHEFLLTNEELITNPENQYYNYIGFSYENNVQVNAGKYIVKANLYAKDSTNYEIVKKAQAAQGEDERYEVITQLSAYATIKQANYDVSFIVLDNDSFQYDGKEHSLQAYFEKKESGEDNALPSGVKMFYENNAHTDAGTYDVSLKFTHSNKNYAQIEPITAVLRIIPLSIDMTGVAFDTSGIVTYDGTEYQPKLVESSLPSQIVEVTYKYISSIVSGGEYISEEVDKCKGAAAYTLIASFVVEKNYETPENITTAFEIVTRMISDSAIVYETVENNIFEYDGQEKYLEVIEAPFDAKVSYQIVDENNLAVEDPTLPGKYNQITLLEYFNGYQTVTYKTDPFAIEVIFTIDDTYFNYESLSTSYSGQEKSPVLEWIDGTSKYDLLKKEFKEVYYQYKRSGESDSQYKSICPTDTGEYICKATFSSYLSYFVSGEKTEFVTTTLTISKVILTYNAIMQFSLNDTDYADVQFGNLNYYDLTTSDIVTKNDTYSQVYEIVYDGRNRTISGNNYLSVLGQYEYEIVYAFGDCDTKTFKPYQTSNDLFNISKTGLYVIKVNFNANNNAVMNVNNDMYLIVEYKTLKFDKSLFTTQYVNKVNTNGTKFDVSNISGMLSPVVNEYEYNGQTSIKPLSYAEANCEFYYAYLDLYFDESVEYIDSDSFINATPDTENGFMSVENEGIEYGYRHIVYKIKVEYI